MVVALAESYLFIPVLATDIISRSRQCLNDQTESDVFSVRSYLMTFKQCMIVICIDMIMYIVVLVTEACIQGRLLT